MYITACEKSLILSSSILTIFWNVHDIPNKKMQKFFKKTAKIQRAKTMIYITEFDVNSEYNFPRSGESVLMASQRLRCWPTLKSTILK